MPTRFLPVSAAALDASPQVPAVPSWIAREQGRGAGAALARLRNRAMERVLALPVLLLRDRRAFLRPGDRRDPETATFDVWRRAGIVRLRGGDGLALRAALHAPNGSRPCSEG